MISVVPPTSSSDAFPGSTEPGLPSNSCALKLRSIEIGPIGIGSLYDISTKMDTNDLDISVISA